MANVTITQLPAAGPIQGDELVPIVQNGQTVRSTTAAVAGSPVQTQTFLTLNQEPSLNNSRALAGGTGVGLVDGGAQSTLQVTLNGASGSLEAASNGVIVKTGASTVTNRSIAVSGTGLAITNGDGVSGNPTVALDGLISAVAQVGGTGLLAIQCGTTAGGVLIAGTANEIDVANGNGQGGNPTISISDDPIIPGTGGMRVPSGTTAQQSAGPDGALRYNSDIAKFEGYAAGSWTPFSAGAGVDSFSAGTTGLTPSVPTTSSVVLGGILNVSNGGTGTTTPSLVAGTNVTITGTWPNQTINSSGGGGCVVTSFSAGTTGLTPVCVSTGAITLAGTLASSNGGTGLTTFGAADRALYSTSASALTAGTLPFAAGGTGQTTQQAALNALSGTLVANRVLRSNGTNVTLSQVALNTDVSGILPSSNGGTGQTSYTNGQLLIGNSTGSTLTKATLTAGTGISISNGAGSITISSTGGGASCATPSAAGIVFGRTCNSVLRTALGANAGLTSQGGSAVAIGACAGLNTQGGSAVAIGRSAGSTTQGNHAVAIGLCAGLSNQGNCAIAIGRCAGRISQPACSIAIGVNVNATGVSQTHIGSIRFACCVSGYQSLFYCGTTKEIVQATGGGGGVCCATPTAAGIVFGETSICLQSTSLGYQAGQSFACNTVAIGYQAGSNQCCNTVAVGALAGQTSQSACAVAIGRSAGNSCQGSSAIAIGRSAGNSCQGGGAVAIGFNAGLTSQGNIAIAIGGCAASGAPQGSQAVAIGYATGYINQGVSAVAIGYIAGAQNQSIDAVAIGYSAGFNTQGFGAVAIGSGAGNANQGANSIAIGVNAGSACQHANSIILNATACGLQSAVASALYVKPIRAAAGPNFLKYNPATGEITYV